MKETVVRGTFEFCILPDGKHVNMRLMVNPVLPEYLAWFQWALANHVVWAVHAGAGDASDIWMSMVQRHLYVGLFRHVYDDQYVVPIPRSKG